MGDPAIQRWGRQTCLQGSSGGRELFVWCVSLPLMVFIADWHQAVLPTDLTALLASRL